VNPMQRCLPVMIVRERRQNFGKLDMPLRAFDIGQALEDGVLQKRQPFRVAVIFSYNPVLVAQPANIIRVEIRLDVMDMAAHRTPAKIISAFVGVSSLEQHVGSEVRLRLFKQFRLLCCRRHRSLLCSFR
jgi:hypothetical protein